MIIFVRHAERGDNQFPQKLSEIPYDPPINQAAYQTIKQVSQELSTLLKQHQITKFNIMSSKFLRCLMTAKEMEKNLKTKGLMLQNQKFVLEDLVCEYLREDWFKEYPLNNMIYQTEHIHKYVSDLKWEQKSPPLILPFPQNFVKFHDRLLNFKNTIKFPDKDTCLIIVTHGLVVRSVCFNSNKIPDFQSSIKYCGYAAFTQFSEQSDQIVRSKL